MSQAQRSQYLSTEELLEMATRLRIEAVRRIDAKEVEISATPYAFAQAQCRKQLVAMHEELDELDRLLATVIAYRRQAAK